MSSVDQQHDEETQLAAYIIGGLGSADRQERDDRPELKAKVADLMLTAEGLSRTLTDVNGEISLLRAQLLPDDERARLAQLARDIRDDNLPDVDADIPVTRCPDWCEVAEHDGEGKNHEGAISAFHLEGYPGERVVLGVYVNEDGTPVVSMQADMAMRINDADRLMVDIERAKQLCIQIEAAR